MAGRTKADESTEGESTEAAAETPAMSEAEAEQRAIAEAAAARQAELDAEG